jgi:hypothetical protein
MMRVMSRWRRPAVVNSATLMALSTVSGTGAAPARAQVATTRTIDIGLLTLHYPSRFHVATYPDGSLPATYIPLCRERFSVCVYVKGDDQEFTGAAVRVDSTPVTSRDECLRPTGPEQPPVVRVEQTYALSAIRHYDPGESGFGHYASGELYRLFVGNSCYELEARLIWQARQPRLTKDLTRDTRMAIERDLHRIVQSTTLATGQRVKWPG